jgi:hypothetical protein
MGEAAFVGMALTGLVFCAAIQGRRWITAACCAAGYVGCGLVGWYLGVPL